MFVVQSAQQQQQPQQAQPLPMNATQQPHHRVLSSNNSYKRQQQQQQPTRYNYTDSAAINVIDSQHQQKPQQQQPQQLSQSQLKMVSRPKMGLTTNIKVAVSNRLKSATPTSPQQHQQQSSKEQQYAGADRKQSRTKKSQHQDTIASNQQQMPYKTNGSQNARSQNRLLSGGRRRNAAKQHAGATNPYSHNAQQNNQNIPRGPYSHNPMQNLAGDQVNYGTLLQKRLDSRGGYCGSYQGALQQQRLCKGSNFSQLSKKKNSNTGFQPQINTSNTNNLTQSFCLQKSVPLNASASASGLIHLDMKQHNNGVEQHHHQSRNRVFSATNKTADETSGGGFNAGGTNETIQRRSKPALDYLMNMNSIKSSMKSSDPAKFIQNSISSECLNAQKISMRQAVPTNNIQMVQSSQGQHMINDNTNNSANNNNNQGNPKQHRAKFNFSQQIQSRNNNRQQASTTAYKMNASSTNPITLTHKSNSKTGMQPSGGTTGSKRRTMSKIKSTSTNPIMNSANREKDGFNSNMSVNQVITAQQMSNRRSIDQQNETVTVDGDQNVSHNYNEGLNINKTSSPAYEYQKQQHFQTQMNVDQRLNKFKSTPLRPQQMHHHQQQQLQQQHHPHQYNFSGDLTITQNNSNQYPITAQTSEQRLEDINFMNLGKNFTSSPGTEKLMFSQREIIANQQIQQLIQESKRGILPSKDDNAASPQPISSGLIDKNQLIGKSNGGGRNQLQQNFYSQQNQQQSVPPLQGLGNLLEGNQVAATSTQNGAMVMASNWSGGTGGLIVQSEDQAKGVGNTNMIGPTGTRSSLIFLRDDAGTYYQIEENRYMKLQLEEMQQSANQMTGYPQQKSSQGQKPLKVKRKRQSSTSGKRASLVVNLTKQQKKKRTNSPTSARNDTSSNRVNSNRMDTQTEPQNPNNNNPLQQSYSPNTVHINGVKYVAVNLNDIPESAPVITVPKNNQPPSSAMIHSMNPLQKQSTTTFLRDSQPTAAVSAAGQNPFEQFKSGHQQFIKCMRNFSANKTQPPPNMTDLRQKQQHQVFVSMSFNNAPSGDESLNHINGDEEKSAPLLASEALHQPQQQTNVPYVLAQDQQQKTNEYYQQAQYFQSSDQTHINSPTNMNPISYPSQAITAAPEDITSFGSESFTKQQQQAQSQGLSSGQLQSLQAVGGEVVDSTNLSSITHQQKGIRTNFPSGKQLFNQLKQGRIDKAFIQPTQFKTGNKFTNKSEEARFVKKYDSIIKLRHILLNDKDRAKLYTGQVLQQYFSEDEIAGFSELGILNFQNAVKMLPLQLGPNSELHVLEVREFILSVILANRNTKFQENQQYNNPNSRQSYIRQSSDQYTNVTSPQEFIYNFEVENGNVTSLGLNSGKRLNQQEFHRGTSRPAIIKSNAASSLLKTNTKGQIQLIQRRQPNTRNNHLSRSQNFAQSVQAVNRAKSQSMQGAYQTVVSNNQVCGSHNNHNMQLMMNQQDLDISNKNLFDSRVNSHSPTIASANQTNPAIYCAKGANTGNVQIDLHVKEIKGNSRGGFTPKNYANKADRKVYYNPFNEGDEFFVQRKDIPDLEPMWGDDKGEARHKVYSFLNDQNLRLVKEIESSKGPVEQIQLGCEASLVNEINEHNPKIKQLKVKHMKDGIMRRNGLLLEHIMHERLQNNQATVEYFKTPGNIEQLRSEYRPELHWPKRQDKQQSTQEIIDAANSVPIAELELLQQEIYQSMSKRDNSSNRAAMTQQNFYSSSLASNQLQV